MQLRNMCVPFHAALSSAVNVQITVRDVNDNAPEFVQDIFTTTVPEFLALGGLALQVSASLCINSQR